MELRHASGTSGISGLLYWGFFIWLLPITLPCAILDPTFHFVANESWCSDIVRRNEEASLNIFTMRSFEVEFKNHA